MCSLKVETHLKLVVVTGKDGGNQEMQVLDLGKETWNFSSNLVLIRDLQRKIKQRYKTLSFIHSYICIF